MPPIAKDSSMAATAQADLPIPLISFESLIKSSPNYLEAPRALLSAFRTSGFLYLADYSSLIPPSVVNSVFAQSARFFARPRTQKDSLACPGAEANRGYLCMGREKVSKEPTREEVSKDREKAGEDLKESFEIGREGEEGYPNHWPDELDEDGVAFSSTMQDFFLRCKELHARLMSGIALGMGLDGDFFDEYVSNGDNNLRLLHYPAVAPGGFEGGKRMRAGAHSDYGSVTLLFQDQRGGLQVEKADGSDWLDVEPRENTIVVNAGDVLARWSNDMIRSTKHRVVEPPFKGDEKVRGHPPRYSVAYFCNPNFDKWIEALPGTWENVEGGKKYEGINSRDYLIQRLASTY